MLEINEEEFRQICLESITAAEAARKLNMHFNTFRRYALKYDCYFTNQSHKGMKMSPSPKRLPTQDILNGKYPDYSTYKLKLRLLREGYLEDKCQICGWSQKREGEEFTPCELHHKDGNSHNHSLDNLILLCPNCHSLTDNYRSKNRAHQQETLDVNAV